MNDQTEVTQTEQKAGTTGFGISQLSKPTPMWVTWIFRTEFVFNKAAMIWLASTSLIKGESIKEIILTLTIIDFLVWGIGRFVGFNKTDFETK